MFSLCMCGFSPDTPASSHHPKKCFRSIGDSKLTIGVRVHSCLSLCGPVMDWRLVSCPMTAGIGIENGWIDGCCVVRQRKMLHNFILVTSKNRNVLANTTTTNNDNSNDNNTVIFECSCRLKSASQEVIR